MPAIYTGDLEQLQPMGRHPQIQLGAKYGQLTVVDFLGTCGGHVVCRCRCDCGREISAIWALMKRKSQRSVNCGCRGIRQKLREDEKPPGYEMWVRLRREQRLCDEWFWDPQKFSEFYQLRPSVQHKLVRLRPNERHSPSNSCWDTRPEILFSRSRMAEDYLVEQLHWDREAASQYVAGLDRSLVYQLLRESGELCYSCFEPAVPGRHHCEFHLEVLREYARRGYERKKARREIN
jgi:hypothetical protein